MEIGDIPFNILDLREEFKTQSNYVSINGYLYCLITPEVGNQFIASFSLKSFSFGAIELPLPHCHVLGSTAFEYEGNLGIVDEHNHLWLLMLESGGQWRRELVEVTWLLASQVPQLIGSTHSQKHSVCAIVHW